MSFPDYNLRRDYENGGYIWEALSVEETGEETIIASGKADTEQEAMKQIKDALRAGGGR